MNPLPASENGSGDPAFNAKIKTACLMGSIIPLALALHRTAEEAPLLEQTSLWPVLFFLVAVVGWLAFAVWMFQGLSPRHGLWPAFRASLVFSPLSVFVVGGTVRSFLPPFLDLPGLGPGVPGFLSMLFCQFVGIALVEEASKWWFSRPFAPASRHERLASGFAAGLAFGLAEGLYYSFHFYAGRFGEGFYFSRFITCALLHASWTALAAVSLHEYRRSSDPWNDAGSILRRLALPALLHASYNSCLAYQMNTAALLVAATGHLLLGRELVRASSTDLALAAPSENGDCPGTEEPGLPASVPSAAPMAESAEAGSPDPAVSRSLQPASIQRPDCGPKPPCTSGSGRRRSIRTASPRHLQARPPAGSKAGSPDRREDVVVTTPGHG